MLSLIIKLTCFFFLKIKSEIKQKENKGKKYRFYCVSMCFSVYVMCVLVCEYVGEGATILLLVSTKQVESLNSF